LWHGAVQLLTVQRCFGDPNTMTPLSPEIGAEIDQIGNVPPTSLA